ncbi:hypothetical protein VM98_37915, partial [Streptomyces rubellomurinus subsp. indigoferus]
MPRLLRDDVALLLDPADGGVLPHVYIVDTAVADWQSVLDLVVERGWADEYTVGDTVRPLPSAATVLARPPDAECPNLCVRPSADVCAIFRFLGDEQIDFDVS